MDIQQLCLHTYLRWENKIAVCAVCSKKFEYPYFSRFVGTFVREELEEALRPPPVYTTMTVLPLERYTLEDW